MSGDLHAGAFGNWFGFSFSQWNTYRECPRAWWYQRVYFWRGWEKRQSPRRKLTYALTKLRTVWGLSGAIAHAIMQQACDVKAPTVEKALEVYRFRMQRGWMNAINERWRSDPKERPSLHEVYYHHPEAAELFHKAMGRGEQSLIAFFESPAWERALCGKVTEVEELEQVLIGDVPVWVQIDLEVKHEGLVWLTDHKTGRPQDKDRAQAMLYALARLTDPRLTLEQLRVTLAYHLDGREEVLEISEGDLADVRRAIVASANELRGLLVGPRGPERNEGPIENFPKTEDRQTCERCSFHHVCKGTDRIPWGDRSDPQRPPEAP